MSRILIVEDTSDIRQLLEEALSDAGHEIEATARFDEARDWLNGGHYDLLISNVLLPGGHQGTELCDLAKSRGIPHFLITGHPEQMHVLDAEKRPYLPKPFRINELLKLVAQLCGKT